MFHRHHSQPVARGVDLYDAAVVHDLVKLIEKLGCQPLLAPFKPNGKPKHIKGFLRSFTETEAKSSKFLSRVHELGIPMVGPDPAMVLCYRDEYTRALADTRGPFEVLLFQEWLLSVLPQLPVSSVNPQQFYLFGHCTEKNRQSFNP